jgi:hypothetical protein
VAKWRWSIWLCALLACTTAGVQAAVTETCMVQFFSNRGWSREFQRNVTFFTGRELSTAPSTLKFNLHDAYALIAFDRGTLAVVQFDDTLIGIGREFTRADFDRSIAAVPFRAVTQIDAIGKGIKWRIRVPAREPR